MSQEIDVQLPKHIDAAKLVKDPAGRPGHWYHRETDEVFACGADWTPNKPAVPKPATPAPPVQNKTAPPKPAQQSAPKPAAPKPKATESEQTPPTA